MKKSFMDRIDKQIFGISSIICAIFVIWAVLMPTEAGTTFNIVKNFITDYFGWTYSLGMTAFLVFSLFIAFSKYGNIKLGKDDDKPEYSTTAWFFMLFSAGMGIGLVFWSIAEPMNYFSTPPFGEAFTPDAAEQALRYTFFHWGLHPWGVYALTGMGLAYFSFRKGMPFLVSSAFTPILGESGTRGGIGKAIDVLAVFATVFGVATSLGLGAMQITTGLNYAYGIPDTTAVTMIIVAVFTVLFTASVASGIGRGIKYLSYINMTLAFTFIAFFLIFGPYRFIADSLITTIGNYIYNFPWMSLFNDPYNVVAENTGYDWVGGWTIFYWAWWIAWAPFVGSFIARISKGRTVREFVIGVLIAPVLLSFIWLATFGSSAMSIELFGVGGIADAVAANVSSAFFVTLEYFPLVGLTTLLGTLMIGTFFITSADSATLVVTMLTTGGDPRPGTDLRIIWGILQGAVAAVLLLAGGLGALQTASIAAAFPFMIVLIFMMYCIWKSVKQEFGGSVVAAPAKGVGVSAAGKDGVDA
jgi:glycine betaine transporter